MTRNISEASLCKLRDYEKASLAQLIIGYAVENAYSVIDIATAAGVSRITIHNWINGLKARNKNLAALVLNLEFLSILDQLITPSSYQDRFSAEVIKKHSQLKKEVHSLKTAVSKIQIEKTDKANLVMQRKYFKYFGSAMINAALAGKWYFDSFILPWDDADALNIMTDEQYEKFHEQLAAELEEDGFHFSIDESVYSLSLILSKCEDEISTITNRQFVNLQNLSNRIDNIVFFEMDWLGSEADQEDHFAWFLEWVHTPGRIVIEHIFKEIEKLTLQSVYQLRLSFYTICSDDYDSEGNTKLKIDETSYRDDEYSLYYAGMEIPVDEAFLKLFFLIKGFRFTLARHAAGVNRHIATIDWS